MKKILISISVLLLLATNMVQGQSRPVGSYYSLNWNISVPIGDFNKWIAPASFLGFSASGRYFLVDGFGLGWYIGYNNYYEKDSYETYDFDGGAISASHYKYTFMVPFKLDILYHYKPAALISPYIAVGIGGTYNENRLLVQEYDSYENTWDFLLSPELGVLIHFDKGSNWGVRLGANYTFTTTKTEYFNLKNFSMFNFMVGIAYTVY